MAAFMSNMFINKIAEDVFTLFLLDVPLASAEYPEK